MTSDRRVLFVSHEGTRTGAPMMLLHFVRWLRDHSTVDPAIALLRGGPLTEEFAEAGPTTVLGEQVNWPAPTLVEAGLAKLGRDRQAELLRSVRLRRQVRDLDHAPVVYLNSAASLRLLHHLPRPQQTIAHVHELASALRWSLRPEDPPLLRDRVDHVVAAADCVADNLVHGYDIPRDRITRVYEFIDPGAVLAPPASPASDLRAELGIPPGSSVVGGSGYADWRKGIDLFVQMARTMRARSRDDVHFVWVGDRAGGAQREELDFDIEQAGLQDRLHFAGLRDRPFDWYRTFDVFALTSREDPYPLVGLETAVLEIPMVCFDAGGMTELVARADAEGRGPGGVVVPYLDVEAMASTIGDLLADDDRRTAMGRRIGEVVRRDHDVDAAAPQLLEVVERALRRAAR